MDSIPSWLSGDPLARMAAYRLSLNAADVAREDARLLANTPYARGVASQLLRAVGSIGANVAEGYSRGSGRDRARLFEYALGSTRESLHWYATAGGVLVRQLDERWETFVRIRRILLDVIPRERHRQIDSGDGR